MGLGSEIDLGKGGISSVKDPLSDRAKRQIMESAGFSASVVVETFKKGLTETNTATRKILPENNGIAPGLRAGEHGIDDRSELQTGK